MNKEGVMRNIAVKTDELTGAALDWAVADAIGLPKPKQVDGDGVWHRWYQPVLSNGEPWGSEECFHPSTDWSQCGPLINRFKVMVDHDFEDYSTPKEPCYAESNYYWAIGETELIAICRTIVKRHFGESVNVPAELVETA
ncbi:DUF2591 family protein [Pantoea sp. LMR881]|uniref:phage protein NinX family protein n=1 Tax=Pantoea sp. LMR881 TaxID=3014336 RepID=UPI0022B04A9A|nr:phage protein NinX family protein [Pantoea sp. LMR881]MCZ4061211.1 DUF2591 family protein [Pantoea sp. LMR881]MCZ4061323.1 DUF2591 family protein [Pantoea sp. LMR881]